MTKKYSIKILLFSILLITTGCSFLNNNDYVNFEEYQELNPQELHSDYISNEIAAKDKYSGNYYYFSGVIYDIEEFLNDNYLQIRYKFDQDETKIIELNAYFTYDSDELKSLKKNDNVTVYCKFKQRNIEDYANTVTSYSLKDCRLKS